MPVYAAFLRGINVGGKHVVKMAELRALCERLGLKEPRTYIQSGNLVFASDANERALREMLEPALEQAFGFAIPVILRTAEQLSAMVSGYPFSMEQRAAARAAAGEAETEYVFLFDSPVTDLLAGHEGADRYRFAGRDLYLLLSRSVRDSKLVALMGKALPLATSRNLRTLTQVLALTIPVA